jgi:D-tyrosyl-tRNA(Tyr) deacylase
MRIVIQRVREASVIIDGSINSSIEEGLLILVGIEDKDTHEDIEWLCQKIANIRIFNDSNDVMNKSILDTKGEVLIVSQFTLHASTKKGNRPSYIKASKSGFAIPMYESFCMEMSKRIAKPLKTGIFGADMKVNLTNDGPVTIFMDSKNRE